MYMILVKLGKCLFKSKEAIYGLEVDGVHVRNKKYNCQKNILHTTLTLTQQPTSNFSKLICWTHLLI